MEEVYICAPLSLQGTQMLGSHWGGQAYAPFSMPTSLSFSLAHCVSLLFQLTLHWCGEGAFDIHNLVQRRSRSPESLYGFHGNRLVQRTRCSAVVVGKRETYSRIRLHKCGRSWINSLQGGQGEAGQGSGGPTGGAAYPTHWGLPSGAAHLPCGSWQAAASPTGLLSRC